jgi:hypothetical protein
MKDTLRLLGILFVLSAAVRAETQPGYVILTTTSIVTQSSQLANFVTSKEARGFAVSVIENRSVAQGGWGGGMGDTAAENIRDWLTANYTNQNGDIVIDYVLLIGNPHPTNGDAPMKLCHPVGGDSVPSDLYYASLNANWDVNTNGVYGEWADRDTNVSPWYTEFTLGRIPHYGSVSNLDGILARTMAYEAEGAANASWRDKVLLPFDESLGYFIWTASIGESIKNGVLAPAGRPYHRVYDTDRYGTPETLNCIASNVLNVLTNNAFGLVLWFCHGTDTSTYGQILDSSDAETLQLAHPIITFQASCQNAYPETTNNLAYTLLKTAAVVTIGGTRITYYAFGNYPASNNGFLYGFAANMVTYKMTAGDALFEYKASNAPGMWERWKNDLDYNIYGCPAIGILSVRFAGPTFSF